VLLGEDAVLGRRVWIRLLPAADAPLPQKRRDVGRTTRPRWLASGRQGEWQWDAFVASSGCPLPELVRQRQQLPWPETQYLLEQLTEELAAACADGTLPAALSLEQVWVQSNGRLQVLDAPLTESSPTSGTSFGAFVPAGTSPGETPPPGGTGPADDNQRRTLALLGTLVRLALEGRLPPAGSKKTPLQAPLPGYAARRLNRLVGVGRPYGSVAEFHADLESVRDRPAEVSRPRRRTHLTLQGLALAPGLLWMLVIVPFLLFLAFTGLSYLELRARDVQADLEGARPWQAAVLVVQAEPWPRLLAAVELQDYDEAAKLLPPQLDQVERERQVVLESASWFTRRVHDKWMERLRFLAQHPGRHFPEVDTDIPSWAPDAARHLHEWQDKFASQLDNPEENWQVFASLAAWPLVWIVWAFLWRGGLCFRLAGIALVQGDGRRAARWRCAWRALLVWLPPLLLLVASAALELWRLEALDSAAAGLGSPWPARLAWLTWWLAAGLLPLYFWLAQRSPGRALHDRLAGTYLVPR